MTAALAHARLLLDIFSMKIFVWVLGRSGELLDSHLFFFDRYSDLAEYHQRRGRIAKAERLAAIAEAHYRAADDDDDAPKVAAMAMPVPARQSRINAVSRTRPGRTGRGTICPGNPATVCDWPARYTVPNTARHDGE